MSTAHDALRASATVRNMDEAGALAALMLGWGFSPWLIAQVITAIGNDTYRTGSTAGAYTRYLMAAGFRELLAGEPPARQIPPSTGRRAAIEAAAVRILHEAAPGRFNGWPGAVYFAAAYATPIACRDHPAGWRCYINAAATRYLTRGES